MKMAELIFVVLMDLWLNGWWCYMNEWQRYIACDTESIFGWFHRRLLTCLFAPTVSHTFVVGCVASVGTPGGTICRRCQNSEWISCHFPKHAANDDCSGKGALVVGRYPCYRFQIQFKALSSAACFCFLCGLCGGAGAGVGDVTSLSLVK